MSARYDLIVIGTGNAGQLAATVARDAGMRVAIIEGRDVGGTCALRGCIPKKVLAGALRRPRRACRDGARATPAGRQVRGGLRP